MSNIYTRFPMAPVLTSSPCPSPAVRSPCPPCRLRVQALELIDLATRNRTIEPMDIGWNHRLTAYMVAMVPAYI